MVEVDLDEKSPDEAGRSVSGDGSAANLVDLPAFPRLGVVWLSARH